MAPTPLSYSREAIILYYTYTVLACSLYILSFDPTFRELRNSRDSDRNIRWFLGFPSGVRMTDFYDASNPHIHLVGCTEICTHISDGDAKKCLYIEESLSDGDWKYTYVCVCIQIIPYCTVWTENETKIKSPGKWMRNSTGFKFWQQTGNLPLSTLHDTEPIEDTKNNVNVLRLVRTMSFKSCRHITSYSLWFRKKRQKKFEYDKPKKYAEEVGLANDMIHSCIRCYSVDIFVTHTHR